MSKSIIKFSLLTIAVAVSGCSESGQGRGVEVSQEQSQIMRMDKIELNAPLTKQEISIFLEVIQQLPEQKIPPFTKADLSFELKENESFEAYVDHLQQSLRAALDPTAQAEHWHQQKKIVRAFKKTGISAQDFATLATKVSLAWSASSIRGELPILRTQRKLNERLEQVKIEFETSVVAADFEKKDLQDIQELVALSEFLRIVQEIPDESLKVIKISDQQLVSILPEVNLAAQFEKFLNDSSEVAQTRYTIH